MLPDAVVAMYASIDPSGASASCVPLNPTGGRLASASGASAGSAIDARTTGMSARAVVALDAPRDRITTAPRITPAASPAAANVHRGSGARATAVVDTLGACAIIGPEPWSAAANSPALANRSAGS